MAIKKKTTIKTGQYVIVAKDFDEQEHYLRVSVFERKGKKSIIKNAIMRGKKYRISYDECTQENLKQLRHLILEVRRIVKSAIQWSEYWETYEEN